MSVAYELPPRARPVRPQAPAVVLPFPRRASAPVDPAPDPAVSSVRPLADAAAAPPAEPVAPASGAALTALAGSSRERVAGGRRGDGMRGPVECPTSRPLRDRTASGARGRLRLTTRGRRLRALVCACAFVAAGWITVSAIHSAITSPVVPPSAPAAVHVHHGDTLWSIAARIAPRQDPRRVVDVLRSANHLSSNTVHPGQQLRIPH